MLEDIDKIGFKRTLFFFFFSPQSSGEKNTQILSQAELFKWE